MNAFSHLGGVYAAAVTPLRPDFSVALEEVPLLLDFLAGRGAHGALLLGTTGEGPSFAPFERAALLRAAVTAHKSHPAFRLLAGTGTPSLEETVELAREAFELGVDGVVVLPPYYFRKVSDGGLFAWFAEVIRRAVPPDGACLAYHIPSVTGVPISLDLLGRLKDAFPDRFAGLKDSSADPEHARSLGRRFGSDLLVLNGNDRLFGLALEQGASGCITNLANVQSQDLRQVWDAHQAGGDAQGAHARLEAGRLALDGYPPAPPYLKALMSRLFGLPEWAVRPPLLPLLPETAEQAAAEYRNAAMG